MIVVIADDLSGAAELAGLGLKYGFTVEIVSNVAFSTTDMLIIATNTRSLNAHEAFKVSIDLLTTLQNVRFDWLYKKTDSVLRGHVRIELEAILKQGTKKSCLLVPANPGLNRKVRDGIYYIDGKPLMETEFLNDPGFLVKSAKVMELLGVSNETPTFYLRPGDALPQTGIGLGEASSIKHLTYWAGAINHNVQPAGAADFFEAIIKLKNFKPLPTRLVHKSPPRTKVLFVCGSAFAKSKIALESAKKCNAKVCEMPDDVFYFSDRCDEAIKKWSEKIIKLFDHTRCVIVHINKSVVLTDGIAGHLTTSMAKMVKQVQGKIDVGELFISGGDTANSICNEQGFKTLHPLEVIGHGTVRMSVDKNSNFRITLKPGSYEWPEEIWKFL